MTKKGHFESRYIKNKPFGDIWGILTPKSHIMAVIDVSDLGNPEKISCMHFLCK